MLNTHRSALAILCAALATSALAAGPTDQQDLGRQLADMAERSALALAQRAEEMCQDRWGVSAPAFSKPSLSEPSIAGRA